MGTRLTVGVSVQLTVMHSLMLPRAINEHTFTGDIYNIHAMHPSVNEYHLDSATHTPYTLYTHTVLCAKSRILKYTIIITAVEYTKINSCFGD